MYVHVAKSKIKHVKFLILDIFCILLSFFAAFYLRHQNINITRSGFETVYSQVLAILVLSHVAVVYLFDLYADIRQRGYLNELRYVIKHNIMLMFTFLVFLFMTQQGEDYSRMTYVYFFMINFVLMYVYRAAVKHFTKRYYKITDAAKNVYVITTYADAESVLKKLFRSQSKDFKVKGLAVIDADLEGKKINDIPVVATRSSMYEYVRLAIIDEVLFYLPDSYESINDMAETFIDMGLTVHINVHSSQLHIPNKTVNSFGDLTVISGSVKIATPAQMVMKRGLDICGALVGLLLTGISFILVAPAIKLESPGPVFFKQERVGHNGRRFQIYKYRSMYLDAEERKKELRKYNKVKGQMFKMDDDPRITKVGRFIRRTSIDELPQFWNVLKGDMSLVGTRPPTVDEYTQYELRHKRRLSIKPGLTGMWQVNGRSNVIDFEEVVKLDIDYINQWSLMLDCKLIFRTVGVLFGDRNAG